MACPSEDQAELLGEGRAKLPEVDLEVPSSAREPRMARTEGPRTISGVSMIGLFSVAVLGVVAVLRLAPGLPGHGVSVSAHAEVTLAAAAPACAEDGKDCRAAKCCADKELHCFQKTEFWASCKASCDPNEVDPADNRTWTCSNLDWEGPPPAPADGKECAVSDGGAAGNCLKSRCCKTPGHRCYRQSKFWAGCKPMCNPNAATEYEGKGWDCTPLGGRTPGDSRNWRPCVSTDPNNMYPTLATDVKRAWKKAEARARALLLSMSLEDKVALLHGQNSAYPNDRHGYAGYINPQIHLGNDCAMPLTLNDGPQGYNHYQKKLAGTTTQFPSLLTVAASFDPEVVRSYASVIGDEFVQKGANVLLGPDIEVMRAPLTGRSFETITGEEPFLGANLVVPYVKEMTARGIIVTIKHWLNNNEEIFRMTMNVEVSERAQHEVYMPVFKAAIEAGAGAVMCSYNRVNGRYACENPHLLKRLLRGDLGFKGFVMSDWGATHNAERAALAGLDMEMPGGDDDEFHKLPSLVKAGRLPNKVIDEMASHVLTSMYAAGHFDGKFKFSKGDAALDTNVTTDEHRDVARKTITSGAVLLKNDGDLLPLSTYGQKIAMVGKYCNQRTEKAYGQGDVYSGGGSGYVISNMAVTPLEGLKQHMKDAAEISWSKDASAGEGADIAIVCAAAHSEEGWDRSNLTLPEAAKLTGELRMQSGFKKVVVLAITPGAITTEWIGHADAVLVMFMPGEQVGPAFAQLLTGEESPGGRLPVSFPQVGEKRFTHQQYPGTPYNDKNMTAHFAEGVLVGYRWNEAMSQPAAFPFGFGLSYTSFQYSGFRASCPTQGTAKVSLTITNSGLRSGSAVPQLYVSFPSLQPVVRQLRGFKKVHLPAGNVAEVEFNLGAADWSFYDEAAMGWQSAVQKNERITVSIGKSASDLQWTGELSCLHGVATF